jgi:hypothetical protein
MTTVTHRLNAVELLKDDHRKVKELFKEFEGAADQISKRDIANEAMRELTVHAALEEEIFYPAVADAADAQDEVDHTLEEHAKVKDMIGELQDMAMGDEFDTKFQVMSENVKHHIEEEEGRMLPQAEVSGIDLAGLGEEMAARKQQLSQSEKRTSARRKTTGARKARAHSKSKK